MLTMTVQPSFHWHESVYVHAELSLRSQRTDERLGQKRLKPHKESHSPCLIVLAVLLNANSVTAAQPVLLLPAHMVVTSITGVKREEGQYSCSHVAWFGFKMAVWPTMCGISAILRSPCQGIGSLGRWSHAGLKLTHSYLVTRSRVLQSGVIVEVFEPQTQSDTKE